MSVSGKPHVAWCGWARDLWADPPFRWFRDKATAKFTESDCRAALQNKYRETSPNESGSYHGARYSLLALPVGETPLLGKLED